RADRAGAIRLPPPRPRIRRIPHAWPPGHHRFVRRRLFRGGRRDRPQQSGEQPDRLRHPRPRRARLPLLATQEPSRDMRTMQSDYMLWAKFKRPVRYALTSSEVPHFRMDALPWDKADLDLDGASHPRYAPLRERIAARYGVAVEQVIAADGTSMA